MSVKLIKSTCIYVEIWLREVWGQDSPLFLFFFFGSHFPLSNLFVLLCLTWIALKNTLGRKLHCLLSLLGAYLLTCWNNWKLINMCKLNLIIRYRPGFWQLIKMAWIQYLAILFMFLFLFDRVKRFVFENQVVTTVPMMIEKEHQE